MKKNRLRHAAWSVLAASLSPALWIYTLHRRHRQGKSAASARGMWGHVSPESRRALRPAPGGKAPILWLHAVSVGEVTAARVVCRALRQVLEERQIRARIFLSATTDTGMEVARAARDAGEADAIGFYPIDAPIAVRRALDAVRPTAFATMETELWPLFLGECRARGVATFLVNGRVSDRLWRDGQKFRIFFAPLLSGFDALLMRSHADAERMQVLVGPSTRVLEAGDVKLDAASPDAAASERVRWREVLGVPANALLWAAGSTHAGEEEIVARVYASLRERLPHLRLLVAPRHVERVGQVLELLRQMDLPAALRSRMADSPDNAVIVLDTVGELAGIYSASEAAFVGGSLIERGGHNMLEPVLRGAPVAFGPHVANFRQAAALVEEHGLGRQVAGEEGLREVLAAWLPEREGNASASREAFASRVELALSPHRGASRRVAEALAEALAKS